MSKIKKVKLYYTLIVREHKDEKFFIAFGDYSKAVVKDEREDSYPDLKKKDWVILETSDKQADIDAAVAPYRV